MSDFARNALDSPGVVVLVLSLIEPLAGEQERMHSVQSKYYEFILENTIAGFGTSSGALCNRRFLWY
ncbi:hypothetical protein [Lysinibacter sp. HNR]|uniref:hypothetical protein n=1 Tax=Lysinibacter sp. HNR TaxID=3031408 RepID=UPI002435297E|nr:hypothetical protein [Lysinibacter sp. HNR]WGD37881.1 hypothetical protein FrondiHNR_02915 [Lysinibacter sp. HNR]